MAKIDWLGHASFRVSEGVTVYIDPWKLGEGEPKADVILISHGHYDHLSAEDIEKVRRPDTAVLCTKDCVEKLEGDLTVIGPDETHEVAGVTVRTTRAYNPDKKFHPKENDWLGFLLTIGKETIYYAGDTDVIPEMKDLGEVDVALLPVGGTYTMDAAEAAEAAGLIHPKRCIPYHWGDIVGTKEDAEKFKELCSCPTDIL